MPRKRPDEHPPCPHCGGRAHFSIGGSNINFECLWRQYNVEMGEHDPNDRMPRFTLDYMENFANWCLDQPPNFVYGVEGGDPATTASIKAANEPKLVKTTASPEEKPKKARKSRAKKRVEEPEDPSPFETLYLSEDDGEEEDAESLLTLATD